MTPPILEELLDSDPRLQAVPEPLSHEQNAKDAKTPATMLDLKTGLHVHVDTCPTARIVKRWTKVACVLIGIVLALQVVTAAMGRAYLRETVREVVRDEMQHRRPVAETPSAPWLIPQAVAATKGNP